MIEATTGPRAGGDARSMRRAAFWGCAVALLIIATGMAVIVWTESSRYPGSRDSAVRWHSNALFGLTEIGLMSLYGFPVWAAATLAASLVKRYRAGALTALLFGVCYMGTFAVAGLASPSVYGLVQVPRIVGRAAQRGELVIAALGKYHKDHGEYPESLGELVPQYLKEIPQTGIGIAPEFLYTLPGDDNDLSGVEGLFSYDLWVDRAGLFNHLHYWPEGNYPERVPGAAIERVGQWGLVHE